MLQAATHETGLVSALEATLTPVLATAGSARLKRHSIATLRRLLLTLLTLCSVVHRVWDLRWVTRPLLALVSNRARAYAHGTAERFLATLAQTAAHAALSRMLARWSTQLWHPSQVGHLISTPVFIDTHKKPVASDVLVARGKIGRTGRIQSCRTITSLHDQLGHPLLVQTDHGDHALTRSLPTMLQDYEAATGSTLRVIVADREIMSGDLFAALRDEGRVIVTILRSNQYHGLESFEDVGTFEPVMTNRAGRTVVSIASARYWLRVPSQPKAPIQLFCTLIQDYRRCAAPPTDDDDAVATAEVMALAGQWDEQDAGATYDDLQGTPRLIAIVSSNYERPRDMLRMYKRRWPAQENIFKLWLLPLGLDVNVGHAKQPVENREAAKRLTTLRTQAARLAQKDRQAQAQREQHGIQAEQRRRKAEELAALVPCVRSEYREAAAAHADAATQEASAADARLAESLRQMQEVQALQAKLASAEQHLEQAPPMYDLDHRKDQCMTVFKYALANLGMWIRDQFFPAHYANCGWERLRPFFELPGVIQVEHGCTIVTFTGFNNRALNRDLAAVCQRIEEKQPRLLDGSRLVWRLAPETTARIDRKKTP